MTNTITNEQIETSIVNLRDHYVDKSNWIYDEDEEKMVYDEPKELILDVNKALDFNSYSDDLLSIDIWEDGTFFDYLDFIDDDQKMEAFVKELISVWTSFYEEMEQAKKEREELEEREAEEAEILKRYYENENEGEDYE